MICKLGSDVVFDEISCCRSCCLSFEIRLGDLCSSHLIRICVFHQSSKERRKDVCSCRLRMDVMVVIPGHWAVLLGSCPPPCGCSTQRLRLPRLLPPCDSGDALPRLQPTLVSSLAPLLLWVMAVEP
jgi:hypothetical protein